MVYTIFEKSQKVDFSFALVWTYLLLEEEALPFRTEFTSVPESYAQFTTSKWKIIFSILLENCIHHQLMQVNELKLMRKSMNQKKN